ncbi:uncharacterized protein LOC143039002 [Oratosquilla oratoria]|uniref:uncharacterized protein LOC143039002 n=1 Tax=Oratosquilla oratoria TaxID=337810 RepID=UPI003F76C998
MPYQEETITNVSGYPLYRRRNNGDSVRVGVHEVDCSNTWTRRQRHRQIVTRMYSASPRNAEKFHLRMLLLHVPGATSFDDLKTAGGEQLPTFKDACIRWQLLEDDNELEMALKPISEPPAIQHMEEIQEVNPEVLNIEQRYVFNSVINGASEIDRGLETNHRLFYLDAPGGSGKTFLFNMINDYLVAQNVAVSTSAWTGIAATLLKNGKTLHSIFKLPVPLTETITCNIPPNSDQANILRQNMRTNENEQVFSQWLLQIGNGRVQSSLDNVSDDTIDIPEQCVCIDSLVSDIFDNCTQDEMKSRVILSPKNVDCLKVNEDILRRLPTESKTYLGIDSVSSDNEMEANNYPIEFINSLTPSGMPPHRLNLKDRSNIMLLRNLSITQGLCNGTRLEVLELHNHSILASIMSGSHAQERVLIPRIKLNPSDNHKDLMVLKDFEDLEALSDLKTLGSIDLKDLKDLKDLEDLRIQKISSI